MTGLIARWKSHRSPLMEIVAAGSIIVSASWLIGGHSYLGATIFAALIFLVVVFVWPEAAFLASLASIVVGQVARLSVGDTTILLNDLILPGLVVAWTLRRLASRHWEVRRHSLSLPLIGTVIIMAVSLLLNLGREDLREWLNGSLYFVRWLEYLVLFWIGQDLFRTHARAYRYLAILIGTGVILAILGFIQLKIFPDFTFMVPQGWDPHIGRLLSTWFDPNYLAGYFDVLLAVSLAVALSRPWREAGWWWAATAILSLATLLTFSRSGYVGFLVAAGIVTAIRSRVALFIGILAMVAAIMFVPRIQQRVIGIRTIDETAQLRLVSYRNALTVIGDHPVIGIGYNLYKYVQVEYNFLTKTDEHSASGSDSSLLTVWVTTGTIGFLIYLWLLGAMFRELWRTWHDRALDATWRGFGLGAFAGLAGLLAHSQFVNGLQYPHLMELTWLLVAMAIAVRQPEHH